MNLTGLGETLAPYMPWLFALAILVAAPLAYWHWRVAHEEDEPAGGSEVFADLLRAGDKMTDAEFRRVRALMIGGDTARAVTRRKGSEETPDAVDVEPTSEAAPSDQPADVDPAPPPGG
jgi:hypothetical protein